MLTLCKVTTLQNIGTTYTLTNRQFESMAALQQEMRKHPEEFPAGRYTLIENKPVINFQPVTQYKISME